jgi:ribosomal protein L40E
MTEERKICLECGADMQPVKIVDPQDPEAKNKYVCSKCGKEEPEPVTKL